MLNDTTVRHAKPCERDPEGDENEQCLDEPVREPEREPDEDDRRPPSEEREQRLAQPAEGQLLDERRDEREQHEVGSERPRVRRFPVRRCQPLLLSGALGEWDDGHDRFDDVDRDDRGRRSAKRSKRPNAIQSTRPSQKTYTTRPPANVA